MKLIIFGICIAGFIVYYGFAMKFNNPFDIPKNANSSYILREHVFSNNKGN